MAEEKSEEYYKKKLTPEQYKILRKKGTEPAFSGEYTDNKEEGMYVCAACGQPLFDSKTKYNSGTGWPSFYDAVDEKNVKFEEDRKLFMKRTEVLCHACNSHLGHVFDDGPNPTGKRYCINSAALNFKKKKKKK